MTKTVTTICANVKVDEHVDVTLHIEDLSNEELLGCLDEAVNRNLLEGHSIDREYAEMAYDELRGGRASTALCFLERCLFGDQKPVDKAEAA